MNLAAAGFTEGRNDPPPFRCLSPSLDWPLPDSEIPKPREVPMRIVTLEQGTPEWLAWRREGVGASEAATIMGRNPWETRGALLRVKAGLDPEFGGNEHTARGHAREPVARQLYEGLMGWTVEPVCAEHDEHSFVRASLDGRRADGKLIVEAKAPTIKWHRHVLREGVPEWYGCQIQQQFLVTGAEHCHFVSYCPEHGRPLLVRPVEPDLEFQALLLEELKKFWAEVRALREKVRSATTSDKGGIARSSRGRRSAGA